MERKVKTFKVKIHDAYSHGLYKGYKYKDGENPPLSENEIDDLINNFIKDKNVIDMKTNTYTGNQHNNGGDDSVYVLYTIIYE